MRPVITRLNIFGEKGFSLAEIFFGLTIFAMGLLGLSHSFFDVMNTNIRSKDAVKATNLAHQRLEDIMSSIRYDSINTTNFPNEDYGQIDGGAEEYKKFKRSVSIVDSTNALGTSVLKDINVKVEWEQSGRTRDVELSMSISRFPDIRL